jgi:hypothetical protein
LAVESVGISAETLRGELESSNGVALLTANTNTHLDGHVHSQSHRACNIASGIVQEAAFASGFVPTSRSLSFNGLNAVDRVAIVATTLLEAVAATRSVTLVILCFAALFVRIAAETLISALKSRVLEGTVSAGRDAHIHGLDVVPEVGAEQITIEIVYVTPQVLARRRCSDATDAVRALPKKKFSDRIRM